MCCMVLGSHLDSEVLWNLHLKYKVMQKNLDTSTHSTAAQVE